MKSVFANRLLLSLVCGNLIACSWLGGYFPNKEKDYQFSSELPPLKIPNEMISKGLEKKSSAPLPEEINPVAQISDAAKTTAAQVMPTAPAVAVAESEQLQPIQTTLVEFANGETRMQMNQSVPMSWRIISKALTHKGLEITGRDQANAEFTVQYDPNQTEYKDDSFWDEIDFVFSDSQNQEKPYHLKLLPQNKTTEVVVLDEQGKPISDNNALSLLKLLSSTLNAYAIPK